MKPREKIRGYMQNITLWRTLRVLATILIFIVVVDSLAEAYNLSQAIVWLQEKMLNLTWEKSDEAATHYRVEIRKTSLMTEPPATYFHYDYTSATNFDVELENDHSYQFRVQAVTEFGNTSTFSDSTALIIYRDPAAAKIAVEEEERPAEFSLSQNFPNPFNSSTTIQYTIPNEAIGSNNRVELIIYNKLGQRVRRLVNEYQPAGAHRAVWDGRDDSGHDVGSGHYFYRIVIGNYNASKKMIFMK